MFYWSSVVCSSDLSGSPNRPVGRDSDLDRLRARGARRSQGAKARPPTRPRLTAKSTPLVAASIYAFQDNFMIKALTGPGRMDSARWRFLLFFVLAAMSFVFATGEAMAHAVAEGDKGYIQEISGVNILAFMYLGAKHMVTGYDHILFIFGIIFFLYRMKHIALSVSLLASGTQPPILDWNTLR